MPVAGPRARRDVRKRIPGARGSPALRTRLARAVGRGPV